MKYVDSEKLIAEIERRTAILDKELKRAAEEDFVSSWASTANNKRVALQSILSFITSLQQEQPEVESLIRCELPDMEDDKNLGLCYCNQFGNHRMTSKDVQEIARHFYELGLKARKEE